MKPTSAAIKVGITALAIALIGFVAFRFVAKGMSGSQGYRVWCIFHDAVIKRLQSLGLRNIESKYPAELSGGMRKRVGLARALVLEPEILLYDEPTTGLDPVATKNVDDMIRDISQETGVTSVVISHDMASTFRIAHRISMLYEGKIAVSGTPEDIKRCELPFVREFVEMSGTVTFHKHADGDGDDEDTQTRPGNG